MAWNRCTAGMALACEGTVVLCRKMLSMYPSAIRCCHLRLWTIWTTMSSLLLQEILEMCQKDQL